LVKTTLRDQVLSDVREYLLLADEILAEAKPITSQESYYRLVAVIAEHTRWAVEFYTDNQPEAVPPT
jgi:hypothetical protein